MKISNKYDVIIIGAGIGGLVSAALLSKAGKKVLIVEKESKPGGYMTGFKREDYIFDVSIHLLNGCKNDGYIARVFQEAGIINEIKFLTPKYLYRSIFPDFDIRIPHGIDGHNKLIAGLFPKSRKGLEDLMADMSKLFHRMGVQSSFSSLGRDVLPFLKNTYEAILDKYISDVRLKALLSQLWMYFGIPPSSVRAMDFCYPYYDYAANGGYYPQKGSFAITKALTGSLEKIGARILLNRSVNKILVKDGVCEGVCCGSEKFFSDAIISNMDLNKTVSDLVGRDQFSPVDLRRFNNIRPSISAFEIFLGLNIDFRDIYPDDYEVFVNIDYDIGKQYRDSIQNKVEKAPYAIGIYSNLDRSSAPKGKTALTIIMLAGYDHWAKMSKKEYMIEKERFADILIDRAGKVMPQIKNYLDIRIVSTPLTFERYTNNSKGAIYGHTQTAIGTREVRPNEMRSIKNLYFASAWARQGSGVEKALRAAIDVCGKITGTCGQ